MRQKLQLLQFDQLRELDDDLLGIVTELLGLPASRVGAWVKELCDWAVLIFTTAVNDSIFKLFDVWIIAITVLHFYLILNFEFL